MTFKKKPDFNYFVLNYEGCPRKALTEHVNQNSSVQVHQTSMGFNNHPLANNTESVRYVFLGKMSY